MIGDTNIDLDSAVYSCAEYHHDTDLELFYRDGRGFRLVTDVEPSEYLRLYQNPNDETIQWLLGSHYHEDHHDR